MKKLSLLIMALFFTLTLSVLLVPATFADNSETVSVEVIRGEGEITTVTYGGELGSSTAIDLDALVADGYEFLFYIHNGSIVNDKENEFVVSKSNKIIAVLEKADEPVTVYIDSNGDLLGFDFGENPEEPANKPAKPGLVFHSFAEHKDSPKVLVAQYDRENKEDVIEITVIGGTISPEAPLYNDLVELTPTNSEQFSYWADEDGQVVSTNPNYVISALKPVTLEAVYDEDFVAKPSVYLFNVSGIFEGKQSFLGHVNLVEGYELVEYGLLVSTDVKVLTFENATKLVSSAMSPAHEFLRSLDEGAYKSFRGYAIFKGTDGLVTVYSENNFVVENSLIENEFTEKFDNATIADSYGDGSFVGVNGVTWSYVHSRNEGDYSIDGQGIILRRPNEPSSLQATFTNGIGTFSFEYRKAFTNDNSRKLSVDVTHNGGTTTYTLPEFGSTSGADATVHTYSKELNLDGEVVIKIYLTGSDGNAQVTVDNFKWTEVSGQNIDSKLYTVEFYRETNLVHNIPVLYNTNTNSYNLEVEGHTLVAWKDAEGNVFDFNTPIKSNLKLYAELEINKWNVSFNTDGGTVMAPLTDVEYGSEITKPTDPVKEGYTFVGWFTDPSKTVEVEWPYIVPNQDSVLYAKFEANEYTIITDEQGGSTVADITLPFGSIVPAPQAPTKEGFNFVGWYLNLEDDQPIDFNTFTMPLGGTTIYAKWIDSSVKYTVTFDLKGGIGTIPVQEITAGDLVTKPEDPTQDGFTFIGWSSTEDGSNLWDFDNDLVSDDMILYAVWEKVIEVEPITVSLKTTTYNGTYPTSYSSQTDAWKFDNVVFSATSIIRNGNATEYTIQGHKDRNSTIQSNEMGIIQTIAIRMPNTGSNAATSAKWYVELANNENFTGSTKYGFGSGYTSLASNITLDSSISDITVTNVLTKKDNTTNTPTIVIDLTDLNFNYVRFVWENGATYIAQIDITYLPQ